MLYCAPRRTTALMNRGGRFHGCFTAELDHRSSPARRGSNRMLLPYGGFGGPTIPEYRQPTGEDIKRMTNRMMGKAPKREAPLTTDGVQVVFQTGHTATIRTVALSPNGRYIASSGGDATVKLWDVASGQEVRTLTGFGMLGADTLVFTPDSTRLIATEMGAGLKMIEVNTGREVFAAGALTASGTVVSADGRFAVAQNSDGKAANRFANVMSRSLAVIQLASAQTVWRLPDSESQTPLALSGDGKIRIDEPAGYQDVDLDRFDDWIHVRLWNAGFADHTARAAALGCACEETPQKLAGQEHGRRGRRENLSGWTLVPS